MVGHDEKGVARMCLSEDTSWYGTGTARRSSWVISNRVWTVNSLQPVSSDSHICPFGVSQTTIHFVSGSGKREIENVNIKDREGYSLCVCVCVCVCVREIEIACVC